MEYFSNAMEDKSEQTGNEGKTTNNEVNVTVESTQKDDIESKETEGGVATTGNDTAEKKKKKGLMQWNAESYEYLLLALVDTWKEQTARGGIPWDNIAKKIGPYTRGATIQNHLYSLKERRNQRGLIVPPGPYLDPATISAPVEQAAMAKRKANCTSGSRVTQRKAAKTKRNYREHDPESSDEDETYDPSKGDPEATFAPKSSSRKRKGPSKKVRKLSVSTDVSTGSVKSDPQDSSSDPGSYLITLKYNPESWKKFSERLREAKENMNNCLSKSSNSSQGMSETGISEHFPQGNLEEAHEPIEAHAGVGMHVLEPWAKAEENGSMPPLSEYGAVAPDAGEPSIANQEGYLCSPPSTNGDLHNGINFDNNFILTDEDMVLQHDNDPFLPSNIHSETSLESSMTNPNWLLYANTDWMDEWIVDEGNSLSHTYHDAAGVITS